MKLCFFVSCWGNEVDAVGAIDLAQRWDADGIEGPPPSHDHDREALDEAKRCGLSWIAEVVTGGGYVPAARLSPAQHLDDLRRGLEATLPHKPLFVNTLAGSDAWTLAEQVRFHETAMQLADELQVRVVFETHRSRPMFHPWIAHELLRELPGLRLTCDFSHWCCVCERLVMDEEPELLELIAKQAAHVHARMGCDQGPQVPDPRAPEFARAVEAHLRWWQRIVEVQRVLGASTFTFTPEFGPDGYLHCEPFTQRPMADLREVNQWMMQTLRDVMA